MLIRQDERLRVCGSGVSGEPINARRRIYNIAGSGTVPQCELRLSIKAHTLAQPMSMRRGRTKRHLPITACYGHAVVIQKSLDCRSRPKAGEWCAWAAGRANRATPPILWRNRESLLSHRTLSAAARRYRGSGLRALPRRRNRAPRSPGATGPQSPACRPTCPTWRQ